MTREYQLQPFRGPIELRIDYERELNGEQFAAVSAPPGPSLVIAGAGSGKTRTLIYRVAYLLEQGIPAERMLLLTFTNKAAREMMRRVAELVGRELGALWGGTFHSMGNRVLRQQAERAGYRPDFTILDRDDAEQLLSACVGEMGIDVKASRFPKAGVLGDILSLAANTERAVQEILDEHYDYFSALGEQVTELGRRYAARKRGTNTMDFDDLLALWLKLLREESDLCDYYQRRFQFILVDEYQDTNILQSDLIDHLARRHRNVMVVGDDAQSIYAWRGANFMNILTFPQRYPGAKVFKIETNYRSTPEILNVANAAIRSNAQQFAKELRAARPGGTKPAIVGCQNAFEQAAFVAQRVLELRDDGVELNQMAVLYRSHFHALELQLELTRRNIPFSITSGIRFFEQAHIKDVTAYLKLVVNPRDELAFKRLAMLLPGLGAKGSEKLWKEFERRIGVAEVGGSASSGAVSGALQEGAGAVPRKAAAGWGQWTATMSQLEAEPVRSSASKMIRLVLEAGYEDYLQDNFANFRARREDLEQLASFAQQFETPADLLSQLALLTNLEAGDAVPGAEEDEQLRLSTIHQAKGLEFDVVFVIMLCDGMFPSTRSLQAPEGEEEERRLMYVAITRARNELYLTYPRFRAGFDGSGEAFQRPSRFLGEIPKELVEEWNLTPPGY